jgi:formate hydrogenlyase subunit 3/multisubunit Na+/H+ antiporter MnhD subunit
MLALLAAAPKGPLDTWSPTLLALFALLLPLIALVIVLAFTIDSRRVSAWISVIFTLAAAICTLLVVAIEVAHPLHLERPATFLTFFTGQSGSAAEFTLQWGVLADPLASVVALTVAVVSLLVQIYALSFMRREDSVVRFFCVLLFATFAMLGVTLSTNYFEMLLFFGLVTLSTYLMIGHWWQREEAAAAASRAFIISAIGDIALLAAVAYIYFRYNELNFQALSGHYTGGRVSANGLFIMAILVFIAAAAKSAQFPLHVWLPGSAQAPAPAAALIHSAGSAVCGVYLIARTYGLFHASPRGLALLAIAGGLTAVLGVLWALFRLRREHLRTLHPCVAEGTALPRCRGHHSRAPHRAAGGDGRVVATTALQPMADADRGRGRGRHPPVQHLLEQGHDPVKGAGAGQSTRDRGGHRRDLPWRHGAGSDLRAGLHR